MQNLSRLRELINGAGLKLFYLLVSFSAPFGGLQVLEGTQILQDLEHFVFLLVVGAWLSPKYTQKVASKCEKKPPVVGAVLQQTQV
jgi:hypothetical protein